MAEKKFLDFLDRLDGGGMGKSGGKFEGGGLLSMLGNLLFDPYGSDDKDRMASRNKFYNSQGDAVAPPSLLAPRAGNRAAQKPAQGMSLPIAPSAAPQRMPSDPRLTMPVAPGGSPNDGLGPMPQGMPGDPRLKFNPAEAAPVQYDRGSDLTPANNYVPSSMPFDPSAPVDFTMPDGSPIEQLSQEQVYAKFGEDMSQKFGGSQANAIMSSPNGLAVFNNYVQNGYRLPDM